MQYLLRNPFYLKLKLHKLKTTILQIHIHLILKQDRAVKTSVIQVDSNFLTKVETTVLLLWMLMNRTSLCIMMICRKQEFLSRLSKHLRIKCTYKSVSTLKLWSTLESIKNREKLYNLSLWVTPFPCLAQDIPSQNDLTHFF
jgi:hypothetical protein